MKVKNLKNKILGSLLAAGIPFIGGCETTPQMQSLFNTAAHTFVREGIKGQVNPDSRGTTVNVNNQQSRNSYSTANNGHTEAGVFTFKDINRNGVHDPGELKESFRTGEKFQYGFFTLNYPIGTIVNVASVSSDGEVFPSTPRKVTRSPRQVFFYNVEFDEAEDAGLWELQGLIEGEPVHSHYFKVTK